MHLVGGDARARLVYARPGAADDVLATWRELLGDDALVLPSASRRSPTALVRRGRPRGSLDRIGDVVAVARGTLASSGRRPNPASSALPGQHGGLTPDEQWVPLRLAHNP